MAGYSMYGDETSNPVTASMSSKYFVVWVRLRYISHQALRLESKTSGTSSESDLLKSCYGDDSLTDAEEDGVTVYTYPDEDQYQPQIALNCHVRIFTVSGVDQLATGSPNITLTFKHSSSMAINSH